MGDLSSYVTGENAALVAGVVAVCSTLKATFKGFFKGKVGQRLLPLMPVLLGTAGAMCGIGDAGADTWQAKLVLGVICGFTAGQLFKAGKTSIFGWGIEDQPKQLEGGSSPPDEGESASEEKEGE
jgi:hypothetical protein